ncbi:hypothetical protein HZS_7714 [Henneguya salminicola]|nr:hypothetical protein HZS_7714 [Henneguya salminicola]
MSYEFKHSDFIYVSSEDRMIYCSVLLIFYIVYVIIFIYLFFKYKHDFLTPYITEYRLHVLERLTRTAIQCSSDPCFKPAEALEQKHHLNIR